MWQRFYLLLNRWLIRCIPQTFPYKRKNVSNSWKDWGGGRISKLLFKYLNSNIFSQRIKEILSYLLLNLSLPLLELVIPTQYTYHYLHHPTFLFPITICTVLGGNYFGLALISKDPWIRASEWRMDEYTYPSRSHQTYLATIFNQQAGREKLAFPLPPFFPPPSLFCSISPFLAINIFRASIMCQAFRYSNWGKQE